MKTIKKIFIEKGNTGLYSAFFINENDEKHYIHDAYNCFTYLGCKVAMKNWLKGKRGYIKSFDPDELLK